VVFKYKWAGVADGSSEHATIKPLMVRLRRQAGFTLIELIVTMAIASTLSVIAFAGQQQLRARAQFDAAVNLVVSSVNAAQNESRSGVNVTGTGTGVTACAGGPAASNTFPFRQYVFAGTEWRASTAAPNITMRYYEALPGNTACIFRTKTFAPPVSLSIVAPAGGARALFIRNDAGGVRVCTVNNLTTDVVPLFRGNPCSNAAMTLTVQGPRGDRANITIDPSGLARRN
jgi:prepilin-type N-terminal cleavage/methylation domain-containing protein